MPWHDDRGWVDCWLESQVAALPTCGPMILVLFFYSPLYPCHCNISQSLNTTVNIVNKKKCKARPWISRRSKTTYTWAIKQHTRGLFERYGIAALLSSRSGRLLMQTAVASRDRPSSQNRRSVSGDGDDDENNRGRREGGECGQNRTDKRATWHVLGSIFDLKRRIFQETCFQCNIII